MEAHPEPSNALPPKRKFQFSLLNLLVLMTVCALGFALLGAMRENQAVVARSEMVKMEAQEMQHHFQKKMILVKAENARLRAERGELTIHDKEKAYAIRLPESLQENTWTYRVYLPPGDTYFVGALVNNLPTGEYQPIRINGRPPGSSTISSSSVNRALCDAAGLEPGRYLISLMFYENKEGWHYKVRFKLTTASGGGVSGGGSGSRIDAGEEDWPISDRYPSQSTGGVSEQQEMSELKQALVLLNCRRFGSTPGSNSSDTPYGAMLWIDRVSNYDE